jgi:acetamidase/formamidase
MKQKDRKTQKRTKRRKMAHKDRAGKIHRVDWNPMTVTDGYWDNSTPPVLHITSGDVVEIETETHLLGKMIPGVGTDAWIKWYKKLRNNTPETYLYPDPVTGVEKLPKGANHATLTGPIFIDDAEPGDVLEIEILKIVPKAYAFNLNPESTFLKAGLLPEDFPKGMVRWYNADVRRKKVKFGPGIEIPLRPFPGTIGVELQDQGRWTNLAPGRHGGNIDNKELVAGTVLYLPVGVKGGGLKTGDSHLAQGDGEVNLNGLEGAFKKITLRVTVRKDLKELVDWPMASTPTHWITMGFHTDLLKSCKMAVRKAIRFLNNYYGLPEDEAYAFCSMAVDLRVTQVVDYALGIHAMIPKACFSGKRNSKKNGLLLYVRRRKASQKKTEFTRVR